MQDSQIPSWTKSLFHADLVDKAKIYSYEKVIYFAVKQYISRVSTSRAEAVRNPAWLELGAAFKLI
ncbi:MAG: hypothetical protein ACOC43_15100 [Desulfohalobiaceae bacterium]